MEIVATNVIACWLPNKNQLQKEKNTRYTIGAMGYNKLANYELWNNSWIRNKQNQIFRPKTGIPVFRRILSVLIRFLSTGTGFSNHQSGSYRPEPEFVKTIPVSYQPEPEFRLSAGIPVLNPVPVVP